MFGVIIVVVLYSVALASSCQVDATNSESSDIISDILAVIVPDQKIFILLNVK